MHQLDISPRYNRLVRHHLTVLEGEGILKFLSDFNFQVIDNPPSLHEAQKLIQRSYLSLDTDSIGENTVSIYKSLGEDLASLLQEKSSVLHILFPSDPSKPSAEKSYMEIYPHYGFLSKLKSEFKQFLNPIDEIHSSKILRVLEVGAGTGSLTGTILELLTEHGFQLEYTFSDISPSYFQLAMNKFDKYRDCIKFKVLNLETDAKIQGFSPGCYDVIFGVDVVHATKDLLDSLSNLRQLLRPNGTLCLMETSCQNHITSLFGLLDGYWHFTDTEVRQHYPLISGEKWVELCLKSEFYKAQSIPCAGNRYSIIIARASPQQPKIERSIVFNPRGKWLVFSNPEQVESKRFVDELAVHRATITISKSDAFIEQKDGLGYSINVNEKGHIVRIFHSIEERGDHIEGIIYLWSMAPNENNQNGISQPLLYLCQTLFSLKEKLQSLPKLFVVTKGVYLIGDHLCLHPSSSTVWGIAKSFANEMDLGIKMIDLCPEGEESEKELLHEIWRKSKDNRIAYRKGTRYYAKLSNTKLHGKRLNFPQSDRFQLILPRSKSISDLKFGTIGACALKPGEVEVRRKATALNFRDVFSVLKPDPQFDTVDEIGADFAGVVTQVGSNVTKWKVGDSVFGCNLETFSSHVRVSEDAISLIPDKFTYAEAATLPTVFATAYYSLVILAKMKEGDTVLIHTASGGVGLCAIQLCRAFGAKIIATAGSSRKRAYLRNIGIQHVFHSRNTGYEKDIMEVTAGLGVDIVLNSLTSPGFKEASLRVCKKNARFIEMSKLSIWSTKEVKELRSDVEYTVVKMEDLEKSAWPSILEAMDAFIGRGALKPIPYHRFDFGDIREALGFLQSAQHIGKVVCIMPEVTLESGVYSHFTPMLNPRSTYMITGGLGGIGLEVCKWMVKQGAKHIVLVSRSHPNESHSKVIKDLQTQGKKILTRSVDIGAFSQCQELMVSLRDLPPLRGIMHSAGVINDAALQNQTWDKFLSIYNPKVNGTWNLHELTKNMNLEHFILFSSVTALTGQQGQGNYAGGCAYKDAMASHRVSIGLPATTINWGQWGQVGVAVGMKIRGFIPISTQRGIVGLEAVMKSQHTHVCVADVNFSVLSSIQPQSLAYLQDLTDSIKTNNSSPRIFHRQIDNKMFWKEMDAASAEDKRNVLRVYLKAILRQILKLDCEDKISDQITFQHIGIDSLLMIEFRNNLQTFLGPRLAIDSRLLLDFNSIHLLTTRLMQQLRCEHSPGSETNNCSRKLSPLDLDKLIKEDSQLPEKIRPLGPPPQILSASKTFLITGITGNLGPYILKELFLKFPLIERVYCLMRSSPNPKERLTKNLEEILVDISDIDLSKIHVVVGDLAVEKFCLEETLWNKLSLEVDTVFHIAAEVNHVEPYGLNSMRKTNVHGTMKVLDFCCNLKTKYLFHASTIGAVAFIDDDYCLSEDWPGDNEQERITDYAYPVSKMIADRLVHHAVDRGLPAKSFRFGILTGHSQTGRFNYHNNHVTMRLFSFMKLGAMPDIPLPAINIPLDTSAQVAMKIFLHEKSHFHSDIYNLIHPKPSSELEFPSVAKEFGFDVEIVEYSKFEKIFQTEGEQTLLYPLKKIYETEEKYHSFFKHPALRNWTDNPKKFFKVEKIRNIITDYADRLEGAWEYLRRDLSFAKEMGLFKKFQIK